MVCDIRDIRDSRVAAERLVSCIRLAIVTSMVVIVAVSDSELVPYPQIAWPVLGAAMAYAVAAPSPPWR